MGAADEVDDLVAQWQAQRPDLDVGPMHVLSRVTRLARHLDIARRSAFASHGLETWEFDVLSALRRVGPPFQLTPGALLRATLVTSGTMTNRIDRLTEAGLVHREPDPRDRRGVLVTLTDAGKARVDAALADLLASERKLLAGLDDDRREPLSALLRDPAGPPRRRWPLEPVIDASSGCAPASRSTVHYSVHPWSGPLPGRLNEEVTHASPELCRRDDRRGGGSRRHRRPALPAAAASTSLPSRPFSGVLPVALGDSLSVGDQPNAQGVTLPTNQGYPDQLSAALRRHDRDLRLAKLGCPGETTGTLNHGGICGYAGDERYSLTAGKGTQLAAALAFLRAHRGHVPLITIDIGANDLSACISLGSLSAVAACAAPAIATAGQNLAVTLARLRAADPRAVIVGMSYYVPELAAWLTGPSGQAFATGSVQIATGAQRHARGRVQEGGSARGGRVRRVQVDGLHRHGHPARHRADPRERGVDLPVDLGVRRAASRPERARQLRRLPGHRGCLPGCPVPSPALAQIGRYLQPALLQGGLLVRGGAQLVA